LRAGARAPVGRAGRRGAGAERHEILATIAALPADVTVLLIEHDMDIVFSFADRIFGIGQWRVVRRRPPDEVARDPRVKAVYLGEALDG